MMKMKNIAKLLVVTGGLFLSYNRQNEMCNF